MSKCVYIVRDHGSVIREELGKHGFQVIIGDGQIAAEPVSVCNVLLPGGKVTVDRSLLEQAPCLELVVKSGVGTDRIDIETCTEMGITVANTPLTNIQSVAEHTMMLMLACARKIYPISLYLRHTFPDFWCRERYEGIELSGKTLAVVGLGNIGRKVAGMAQAFGMRIIGYDPFADPAKLPEWISIETDLKTALAQADFVTLHVAGTPQTRGMIGKAELSCMKPSAILINVSRGSVVDEQALIRALENKAIAGAGLDVFEQEPPAPDNPLFAMDNVILSPHNAALSDGALRAMAMDSAQGVFDFLSGKKPLYPVNTID